MQRSHPLRAFLGFILTLLLFISLTLFCVTSALKQSVLKGDTVTDILDNSDIYDTVEDIVLSEFSDKYEKLGISDEMVSKIMQNDAVQENLSQMTESILAGEHVDLSDMKDDVMNIADSTASDVIDSSFEAAEKAGGSVDLKDIVSNQEFTDMENQLGVSVSDAVVDAASDKLGTTTIDLDSATSEKSKQILKETVSNEILPKIDSTFDTYINDINSLANEAVDKINKDTSFSEKINDANKYLSYFSKTVEILMIICVVLVILEFLLYIRDINRSFKNCSICFLFSAMIILAIVLGLEYSKKILPDVIKTGTEKMDEIILSFINNNFSSISDAFTLFTILLFVGFIICTILSILTKRLKAPSSYDYDEA